MKISLLTKGFKDLFINPKYFALYFFGQPEKVIDQLGGEKGSGWYFELRDKLEGDTTFLKTLKEEAFSLAKEDFKFIRPLKGKNKKCLVLDEFLLSCRILGRGVEDAFLVQTLKITRNKDCSTVTGEYLPTDRNDQVKDFYLKHDFKTLKKAQSGQAGAFRYDLEAGPGREPTLVFYYFSLNI